MTKIISWNLLRLRGASLDDVARLVRRERPELLLMQETTPEMDKLAARVGGLLRAQSAARPHPRARSLERSGIYCPSGGAAAAFWRGVRPRPPGSGPWRCCDCQRASVAWPGAEPPPTPARRRNASAPRRSARRLQPGWTGIFARVPRRWPARAYPPSGRGGTVANRPLPGARSRLRGGQVPPAPDIRPSSDPGPIGRRCRASSPCPSATAPPRSLASAEAPIGICLSEHPTVGDKSIEHDRFGAGSSGRYESRAN